MKKGHKNIGFKSDRLSPKTKWMTHLLTLAFGGLLFLILMVILFRVGW